MDEIKEKRKEVGVSRMDAKDGMGAEDLLWWPPEESRWKDIEAEIQLHMD